MIKNIQTSTQAGIALPTYWADPATAAAVRTVSFAGGVSVDAAAGTKRRSVDMAQVCTDTHVSGVVVLDGAFPGTSAWSPPI